MPMTLVVIKGAGSAFHSDNYFVWRFLVNSKQALNYKQIKRKQTKY